MSFGPHIPVNEHDYLTASNTNPIHLLARDHIHQDVLDDIGVAEARLAYFLSENHGDCKLQDHTLNKMDKNDTGSA